MFVGWIKWPTLIVSGLGHLHLWFKPIAYFGAVGVTCGAFTTATKYWCAYNLCASAFELIPCEARAELVLALVSKRDPPRSLIGGGAGRGDPITTFFSNGLSAN